MAKKTVTFLCTGNSSIRQIAEALTNARLGDAWQAVSAGSRPAGFVHPMALQVLDEIGIRHSGRSKSMDEFRGQPFDLVVTVCDDNTEQCPVWLGKGKQFHLGFPDPAAATGSDQEKLTAFRSVRDDMLVRLIPLLEKNAH